MGVVPPLVGVAVNVTDEPVHIEVLLAVIETAGITAVVVIVITLLFAVSGLAQASLLLKITDTASLLASVLLVNVAAV